VKPHVGEDTLAAIATLGVVEPEVRLHLSVCADCAGRLDSLTRVLADVRAAAVDEADEVFDAERLNRQQDHIMKRLEHAGRPARVIEFPHRSSRAGRPMRPFAVRWVAAAAAAGLVIGVYAGSRMTTVGEPPSAPSQVARVAPPSLPQPDLSELRDAPPGADDEILSQVETALATPSVPELQPFDALTPRFRDPALIIR
jgi:hypothetical protein